MRRTILKWLHWVGFGFLLYFLIVEPDDAERRASSAAKTDALATHAGVGVLLAILVAIWWLTYWRNGLASRPGAEAAGQSETGAPMGAPGPLLGATDHDADWRPYGSCGAVPCAGLRRHSA